MNANLQSKFGPLTPEAKAFVEGVGRALREARQQRGEDLHEISAFLRIKPAFLYALEDAEYEAFPGRAYAYGFLRSYADYLGFDGAEVVRRVKQVTEPDARPQASSPPASRLRGRAAYAASGVAVLAVAALLLWQGLERSGEGVFPDLGARVGGVGPETGGDGGLRADAARPEQGQAAGGKEITRTAAPAASSGGAVVPAGLPDKLRASERVPPVSVRARGSTPAAATGRTIDAALPRDGTSALAAEVPQMREGAAAGLAAEVVARAGPQGGDGARAAAAGSGLRIVARDASWVQIRSRDGSYVRTRTLQPGESYGVPDRDDLLLWVGDAGAVELVLDGRRLGPVGEAGAVVRDYPLDARSLRRQLAER